MWFVWSFSFQFVKERKGVSGVFQSNLQSLQKVTVVFILLFKKPERQSSVEEKRKYVVAEILETEKSYVEALQMIQEVTHC